MHLNLFPAKVESHYAKTCRIEKGTLSPKFETLVAITKALNVKLSAILNFSDMQIFNNYNQNHSGGLFNAYSNTEIEKVEELYKALIKEKDFVIKMLSEKILEK